MKSKLAALLFIGSTCAYAQSSVTIDGVLDLGIIKSSGSSAKLDATNGANQLRFRGSEDLGNGLRANFVLGMRFSPESGSMDGSANKRPLFQSETSVGLSGGFGSVKIGRALTAAQTLVNLADPWGTWTVSSVGVVATSADPTADAVFDFGGLGRTDGIFYNSPNFNGFSGAVTLGLKNSAASGTTVNHAKNLTSFWLQYAAGPLFVGAGAEQNRLGDRLNTLLATYDLGAVKLGGTFITLDRAAIAGKKGNDWNLTASAPVGAFTLMAGFRQAKAENTGAKTKKMGLGVRYNLSKNTHIYTGYGRTRTATTVNAVDLGIRHNF